LIKEEVCETMSFVDKEYREIITKAVCGKGRELITCTNYIDPEHKPSSILGCWIINHRYHAKMKSDDLVEVHGSYDINVWYSFNDNTKTEVVSATVDYCDEVTLKKIDKNCLHDDYEIIVNVLQQPNCIQCKIEDKGNKIAVEVEKEFSVKAIGETKVNVCVKEKSHKDHHYYRNEQHHDKKDHRHDPYKSDKRR